LFIGISLSEFVYRNLFIGICLSDCLSEFIYRNLFIGISLSEFVYRNLFIGICLSDCLSEFIYRNLFIGISLSEFVYRNLLIWICLSEFVSCWNYNKRPFNVSNAKLNPIWWLLVLLGAHHIFHFSRVGVNMIATSNKYRTAACKRLPEDENLDGRNMSKTL